MKVNEKIRALREEHSFSQEDMAEKMVISPNAYGKLERGETRLTIEKLEQIANIFNVSVVDLLRDDDNAIVYQVNHNSLGINAVNISSDISQLQKILSDNEKLNLIISHKEDVIKYQTEIIAQKDILIDSLKRELSLFYKK